MFLGIDLGTTYSVGAYIDASGEPQIITNTEGNRTTPSVVYLESEDSVIVGQQAKDQMALYPKDVVSMIKNYMGKPDSYGNPTKITTSFGKTYSPEVISAFILRKIAADASTYLNVDEAVTDVVVTIPAYFDDAQRKATEDAIEIAGLNCLGLINEPTAAALYYATKTNLNKANILVYDLGGGTFDATIVYADGDKIEVKGVDGLSRVGGGFFDKEIASRVCDYIRREYGVNLEDPEYADIYQDIMIKAERAKIALSQVEHFTITVHLPEAKAQITFTVEDIEEIVSSLYRRTEVCVHNALKRAEMDESELQKVIMVGGSSRIPYIAEHLEEYLGIKPSKEVNMDEVVALGAALYAMQLKGSAHNKKKIIDICSHGLGIKALDPKTGEEYNDILIKRRTQLPASVEKVYTFNDDKVDSIYINALEGDRREIKYTSTICATNVKLPVCISKGEKVYVRLEMDQYQILHIFIRVPSANNLETEVVFDRANNLSEAEISEWKKSTYKAAQSIDKRSGRKGIISSIKEKLTEIQDGPKMEKKVQTPKRDKSKDIPKVIQSAMEGIVGMDEVKECLRDIKNRLDMSNKRIAIGKNESDYRCIAVIGKSGMGITTAAHKIAEAMYKIGAAGNTSPVIAYYDDIVKADDEGTIAAIQGLFQSAIDGVLLIDNFEEFYSDNEMAAGMVAIGYLIKAYEKCKRKLTIIISGYDEKILEIFEKNGRFERLFQNYIIELKGYTPKECVQLMHKYADGMGYVVDDAADDQLQAHFKRVCGMPDFEHMYSIIELFNKAKTDVANKASAKRHATDYDYTIIREENFGLMEGIKSLEELKEDLNSLIGLEAAKKQIESIIKIQERTIIKAKEEGREIKSGLGSLHMVFTGNPGTGKTTVARLLGQIYRELGVLEKGQFIEVTRKDLISTIIGDTAKQVEKAVNSALGGILFIDEAYSICKDDNDIYGKEAIDTLVPLIENHKDELMVILAGYSKEMSDFMCNVNSGLASRFNTYVEFEDYSLEELIAIFHVYLVRDRYLLEGSAEGPLKDIIFEKMKDPKFGNARGVRNLFDIVVRRHLERLADIEDWGENEERIIRIEDLGDGLSEDGELAKKNKLDELLRELYSLTGLTGVKNQIRSMVNRAKVDMARREKGLEVGSVGTMHMIFAGNPGTGKTTVARLIGEIYKELGLLSSGRTIECGRADLVASYIGQTSAKTINVVNRAIGNVLFIDEAYMLSKGGENDYGKEAIDTLVAQVENHKDSMVVILAGYTDEMKDFLDVNPGLASRFKNWITFDDYSIDEMMDIFQYMVKKDGKYITDEALVLVRDLLKAESNNKNFGNARGVRNLMERIIDNFNNRIATLMEIVGIDNLSGDELSTIDVDDIL